MMQRIPSGVRPLLTLVGGALLGVALMLAYLEWRPPAGLMRETDVHRIAQDEIAAITPTPPVPPQLYAQLRPAVVLITVAGRSPDNTSFQGRGSGVVVDENGTILTSLHVIAGAQTVDVTFFDGTTARAKVTQTQPERDLATIQVDHLPDGLQPATLGGGVNIGDQVMAIGAPFGLSGSASLGVVSGLNRRFVVPDGSGRTLDGLIQIDAAVNPGNSGGPLIDMTGHVVAIVTGIVNPTGQSVFVGIGFATPIQSASGIVAPVS